MALTATEMLWRRMPPAIFPPLLGLVGLTLALRLAGDVYGFGRLISHCVLCVALVFYCIAAMAYGAKFIKRPGVILQDLQGLPGRAGLAAMSLAGMLLAAALAPYVPVLAFCVLLVSFAGHAILLALVIYV